MYTKDKTNRVSLRLNDEQFAFVKMNADTLGVSPSEFLRMVVNASMATAKAAEARLASMTQKGGFGRENDKACSNDSV